MSEGDEKEVARQIRAALDGPARPLRCDQVESLLEVVRQKNVGEIPYWILVFLTAGLLVIVLLATLAGTELTNRFQLALLIPAVNLVLSPLAAFVIVRKAGRDGAENPLRQE
jgi:hypothetical protein